MNLPRPSPLGKRRGSELINARRYKRKALTLIFESHQNNHRMTNLPDSHTNRPSASSSPLRASAPPREIQ